jgi:hypothetical protein
MPNINILFQMNLRTLMAGKMHRAFSRKRIILDLVTSVALAFSLWTMMQWSPATAFIGTLMALQIMKMVVIVLSSKAQARNPRKVTITFSEKEIQWSENGHTTTYAWKQLKSLGTRNNFVTITFDPGPILVLEKTVITDEQFGQISKYFESQS